MATIEPYETQAGRRYRVLYRRPDRLQTSKRGFRTKRDAEKFAATVEVAKLRGEYVNPADARATVAELGPEWLQRQTRLKPSAYRPLESAWRLHVAPHWGTTRVADVRKTAVQSWITDLSTGTGSRSAPLGPTMVIRCHGVLAAILDDAVDDRRILANPARGVKLPRRTRRPHIYLSHEQVHTLAAASPQPALVLTLAYCGLRWSEAAGLQVRDVVFLRRRLSIERNVVTMGRAVDVGTPKSGKARAVPFPEFLADYLAQQCEGKAREDHVFTEPGGGVLMRSPHRVGWFEKAVTAAGIPRVTPHDLRHSAASFAVSAGANVKAVQRMLGHASAAMTLDVYADLFDDDLDTVAEALDAAARANVAGMLPREPRRA